MIEWESGYEPGSGELAPWCPSCGARIYATPEAMDRHERWHARERSAALVERVRALEIRDGDRVEVRILDGATEDLTPDELDYLASVVGEWAGVAPQRVLLLDRAEVEVVRTEGGDDGE